ncbi:MAG: GHKL domain-containing protein [Turicibacter sp.]|nr:GHKL domain-containing protein [Turicibacter sp.]
MLSLEFIIIFSELYLILFYFLNLKQQKKIWFFNVPIILMLMIIDVLTFAQNDEFVFPVMGSLVCVGLAVLIMIYAIWDFKKIFVVIFAHVFAGLVAMAATGFVFTAFSIDPMIVITGPWHSLAGGMLGMALLGIFYYITKRMQLRINIDALKLPGKLTIAVLSMIFGFYSSALTNLENTAWNRFITSVSMLGGIMFLYCIVVYMAKDTHIQIAEDQVRRHQESISQQEIHYALLQKKEAQTSSFIHDADKLLLPLVEMIDSKTLTGDLAILVSNLKQTTEEIKGMKEFQTGSSFIDGNLQYLQHKYKEANIVMKIEGVLPDNHVIVVSDLITLFSNLLENAFEATVKTSHDKYIEMKIRHSETSLYIGIKNNYDGKLKVKDIGFETTKADKQNHGIGLRSVHAVVEKYNGKIEIMPVNNEFMVEITFPRTIYKQAVERA